MDLSALIIQIINLSKKLNKKQKIVIITTVVVIIALVSFLIAYNSSHSIKGDDGFRVLFNNLKPTDAALIMQELEKNKIPYKLPKDGVIEVPADMVQKVRLQVAALGLPKDSTVGFSLFDKKEFGATDFEQNIKYLRALEGELAKDIESIRAVKKARVNIAIPKDSVFVSKQLPVTASVILELEPNMVLTPKQIVGIKNLVAAAVPRLQPDDVKLINQYGDPLGEDDELTKNNELLKAELEYKKKYERTLENKIVDILAPIVGNTHKVVAKVDVDFDFSKVKSKAEIFAPDNVVRSEQTMEESRQGYSPKKIGGVPGAVSNIGPVQGLKSNQLREKYNKSTTTTNYEISKTIKNIQEDLVKIKRITAAVVVDGKYKMIKTKDGKEKMKYIPLTQQELDSITGLVKTSIGFNPKRGDDVSVSNFQFNVSKFTKETLTPVGKFMSIVGAYVGPFEPLLKYLFLFVVLLIFYKKIIIPFSQRMLEIKPEDEEELKRQEIEFEEEEIEDTYDKMKELKQKVEQQLGINSDINQEEVKYEVLLDRLRDMAEEKPEEVANVLQSLLNENIDHEKGV
ncbi:MAG: flagellar basal body M-ring protein FliF [Epsilonproteobacteria bacterium]|nr:flagellar basal body M-ring protein FliF [Campylobacterota bacterium]